MKATPLILTLLGLAAVGASASALADSASTSVAQEKKTQKKTDEASTAATKEKRPEKITVWIMDSTGSG